MKKKLKPQKVFVAGAAGFIGQRVCRILSERGHQVHALIYSDIEWERVERHAVKCVKGDLLLFSDIDSVQRYLRMEKIPWVVSLVGSVDYRQEYENARRANVDTAKAMVDICRPLYKSGILKKLVFGGSVASRGFLDEPPVESESINEDRSYYSRGVSVYCDVKHEAEELVRQSGLPFVILEPGSLVGREMKGTTTTNIGLMRKILRGVPVLPGGASYTSAECVAEGFVRALESVFTGMTYLLGGENMTMKEFAQLVLRVMAERFPSAKAPSLPVMAVPGGVASLLGSMHLMVNRQQALMGSAFHYIDRRKAEQEIGYRHTMEDLEREIAGVLEDLVGNR
jgi:dihydroflavonol-4-reductase